MRELAGTICLEAWRLARVSRVLAQRAMAWRVELVRAHRALGREAYGRRVGDPARLKELSRLAERIVAKRSIPESGSADAGLAGRLRQAALAAMAWVEARWLESKKERQFAALGRQVEEMGGEPELCSELDVVASVRERIAELERESAALAADRAARERLRAIARNAGGLIAASGVAGWALLRRKWRAVLGIALSLGVLGAAAYLIPRRPGPAGTPGVVESAEDPGTAGVDLSYFRRLYPDLSGPHPARPRGEGRVEYRAERRDGSSVTVTLRDGVVEHVQYIFRRQTTKQEAEQLLALFGEGGEWEHSRHGTGAFDDWVREDGEMFVRRFNGGNDYSELQISTRQYREWIASQ